MDKKIKKIFLIGILIRLLLMPFFAYHQDIFMVHFRALKIVNGQASPFFFREPLTHTIEAFFMLIFKPFFNNSLNFLNLPPYYIPNINRLLFLFKIPYLLFEIAFWKIILKLIKSNKHKLKASYFLAFNPILIYSIYIFSRYESYPLFFLALFLQNINKNQKLSHSIKNSIILSTLVTSRLFFAILFIPILFSSKIKNKIVLLFLPTLLLITNFLLSQNGSGADFSTWISQGQHTNYLFDFSWSLGAASAQIYPLFILITLIIFVSIHQQLSFVSTSTLIFLSFFATTFYHPQYLSWLIPFLTLTFFSNTKEKSPKFIHLFSLICLTYFFNLLTWNRFATTDIFFPISQTISQINLAEIVDKLYPLQKLLGISRSIQNATFVYLSYKILSKK